MHTSTIITWNANNSVIMLISRRLIIILMSEWLLSINWWDDMMLHLPWPPPPITAPPLAAHFWTNVSNSIDRNTITAQSTLVDIFNCESDDLWSLKNWWFVMEACLWQSDSNRVVELNSMSSRAHFRVSIKWWHVNSIATQTSMKRRERLTRFVHTWVACQIRSDHVKQLCQLDEMYIHEINGQLGLDVISMSKKNSQAITSWSNNEHQTWETHQRTHRHTHTHW